MLAIRGQAEDTIEGVVHGVPITNAALMSWLAGNHDYFRRELNDATDRRKGLYNQRLYPMEGLREAAAEADVDGAAETTDAGSSVAATLASSAAASRKRPRASAASV